MSVFTSAQPVMYPPPRYACTRIQPPPYTPTVKSLTEESSTDELASTSRTPTNISNQVCSSLTSCRLPLTIPPPIYQRDPPLPRHPQSSNFSSTTKELYPTTSRSSTLLGQIQEATKRVKKSAKIVIVDLRDEIDLSEEHRQEEERYEKAEKRMKNGDGGVASLLIQRLLMS